MSCRNPAGSKMLRAAVKALTGEKMPYEKAKEYYRKRSQKEDQK